MTVKQIEKILNSKTETTEQKRLFKLIESNMENWQIAFTSRREKAEFLHNLLNEKSLS